MTRTSIGIAAALLACAAGASACRSHDQDETTSTSVPPRPTPSAPAPKDHLAPGELVEGTTKAFGIALPRGFAIESEFPDQVIATGPAKPTDVANFLRARVTAHTTVGAASTMFESVQTGALPGHELAIRVEPGGGGTGTRVTVRDVTPKPTTPGIPEEERWREAGLTPQGKILDPTHLH